MRVLHFALPPSARRVYQPAALPERELLGFTDDDLARIAASGALA